MVGVEGVVAEAARNKWHLCIKLCFQNLCVAMADHKALLTKIKYGILEHIWPSELVFMNLHTSPSSVLETEKSNADEISFMIGPLLENTAISKLNFICVIQYPGLFS